MHESAYQELGGNLAADIARFADTKDDEKKLLTLFGVSEDARANRKAKGTERDLRNERRLEARKADARTLFQAMEAAARVEQTDAIKQALERATKNAPDPEADGAPDAIQALRAPYQEEYGIAIEDHVGRTADRLARDPGYPANSGRPPHRPRRALREDGLVTGVGGGAPAGRPGRR
jgi:thioesterase domain-containing protein